MLEMLGGGLNSGVVLWTKVWQNLQLHQFFSRHLGRLAALVDPYLSVTIAELDGAGRMKRRDAYVPGRHRAPPPTPTSSSSLFWCARGRSVVLL